MDRSVLAPLLLVEDSDEDVELIEWALKKLAITIPIVRCTDGEEALDYLYQRNRYSDPQKSPMPALILLDLQLVAVDGLEVLQEIKGDETLRMIPVIVWTSSDDEHDIDVSFKQGANSYILKPMSTQRLLAIVEMLNQYWFGVAILPENISLQSD
ncbi:two-component system response regulator [Dictyobacter sp. S3.2.2.5]|uniref:Two-component system response regulator n=1 Tax=Dictyobacter halimunensis TaxID=3026934 RepID=A0ABQ6FMJ4_9CHLR|nr:two-component system response regulator [Dictyobacter sp. S3.2.2.5]